MSYKSCYFSVKSNTFNRGVNCSPLCIVCDNCPETFDHLFMKCN